MLRILLMRQARWLPINADRAASLVERLGGATDEGIDGVLQRRRPRGANTHAPVVKREQYGYRRVAAKG
jgi:hypothetical protein